MEKQMWFNKRTKPITMDETCISEFYWEREQSRLWHINSEQKTAETSKTYNEKRELGESDTQRVEGESKLTSLFKWMVEEELREIGKLQTFIRDRK